MPVVNLAEIGHETPEALAHCDVCIVGSGPAGSTLAHALGSTRHHVTLLESGGFARTDFADALNAVVNAGRPRVEDQWAVRNRVVGGSSHTWGGRCAVFDPIDYERRPWVPHSGWPIDPAELTPYLEASAAYLGLVGELDVQGVDFWRFAHLRPGPEPNADRLRPFFWQFSTQGDDAYRYEYRRFGAWLLKELPTNVTLATQATVLGIDLVASGRRVQGVSFAGPDGTPRALRCDVVALCAGGIENARLLLLSDEVMPQGIGNDRDLVGRFLMDHPRGPIATFELADSRELQRRFGRFIVNDRLFRAGVRLSPMIQRDEALLNCAAWLGEMPSANDPLEAVKRLSSGRPRLPDDLLTLAANAPFLARGVYDYLVRRNGLPRRLSALTLDAMCEQVPDPMSRVTLASERDALGQRVSRIDWRVHDDESRTMRRMAEVAAEEWPRIGLPAPRPVAWVRDGAPFPTTIMDVGHPTGTTRMASSPAEGVVDPASRVFGVAGLYVSGSSVFPTAGHCNPTRMIVAMALRLADRLRTIEVGRVAAPKARASGRALTKPKILLTGATGRIGRIVLADLLERGYAVRATTSDAARADRERSGLACEWRHVDFMRADGFDDLMRGCGAVIHLAAELGDAEKMPAVNTRATGALAEAAERLGVASFCYVSSVAVYGSGRRRLMSEDAPVLTSDRDVRSEYWALDYVRAYGRTKLAGEYRIRETARTTRYTIFRPSVVVDIADIVGIRDWSLIKRLLAAHRHAHHIYVRDVSDALIWSLERARRGVSEPGSVELYNLAEDEYRDATHAAFLAHAWAASGDRRFRIPRVPGVADWLHDALRFHSLPLRNPLWRMRFPSERLRQAGYRPRFGLARAHALALESLRSGSDEETRAADMSASFSAGWR